MLKQCAGIEHIDCQLTNTDKYPNPTTDGDGRGNYRDGGNNEDGEGAPNLTLTLALT